MNTQEQFLQQFDDVSKGVSKYITLDTLQVGIPYEVKRFRLHDSVFGRCLVADLAVGFWLVLPKRIGDLVDTEEKLQWLNSKNYWMVFKGRNERLRNMPIIEFKTMEQYLLEQAEEAMVDMPLLQFTVDESGTLLNDIGTQTVDIQVEAEQKPIKGEVNPKSGAAPKVTIKVKKDKK